MGKETPDYYWDLVFEGDPVVAQVKAVRRITEAAAAGDASAVDWFMGAFHGLAELLADIEQALTIRN